MTSTIRHPLGLGRSPVHLFSSWWVVAWLGALAGVPSAAAASFVVPSGQLLSSESQGVYGESFELPAALSEALAQLSEEAVLIADSLPSAPGERRAFELRRVDLYAPDAKVHLVRGGEATLLARTARFHFLGSAVGDPRIRIGLSFDAVAGTLRGLVDGPAGRFFVQEPVHDPTSQSRSREHRLLRSAVLAEQIGVEEPKCGNTDVPLPSSLLDHILQVERTRENAPARGVEPLYSAVVAVDTDMELLDEKFSNNTASATAWIADLFLEMNVAYERDVGLRLLIGDTFLRPGSPPYTGDPWNVTASGASITHLNEFGAYWSANQGAVNRVFAMLLSGKSSSGFSASGIAWVDGYCETQTTGGGYSVTQVFTANFSSAGIVAHELGHNAGSPHTHCYSPAVDQCYRAESGCYSGAVSCPGGGPGTIMSYCNFGAPNGANCGQNSLDFHPTVSALFTDFIDQHTPACVVPLFDPVIFDDGFESGNTGQWSSTVP
jgi:hypothetical protein